MMGHDFEKFHDKTTTVLKKMLTDIDPIWDDVRPLYAAFCQEVERLNKTRKWAYAHTDENGDIIINGFVSVSEEILELPELKLSDILEQ